MTLHRLRETRGAQEAETRAGGGVGGWGGPAYGMLDPTAIPPPGMGQTMRAGIPVTAHTSLQVDAVYTAMRVISNSIIKLGDPRAYVTELDTNNIPYRIWSETQPVLLNDTFGPFMFQYDGFRRTVMSLGLFGEAFWHVMSRDNLLLPTSIEVLNPLFMEVKLGPDGPEYFWGTGAKKVKIPTEDVVHIPMMSMPGGLRGLSSIEYGGVMFALALAALEYGERWFSQGASPSFFLSTEQKLGRNELDRLSERFLVEHGGLVNSHLPLILDGGLKAEKIQSPPEEAMYLQTLEYARSVVGQFFGVPTFLMPNILERAAPEPAGVIGERSEVFLQYTLSGYLIPIQEALSSMIPQKFSVAFDTSKFAEPDAKSQAAEILALRNTMTATVNDVRVRKLGLPPLDDPRADDPFLPLASNAIGDTNQMINGGQQVLKPEPKAKSGHGSEPDPADEADDNL